MKIKKIFMTLFFAIWIVMIETCINIADKRTRITESHTCAPSFCFKNDKLFIDTLGIKLSVDFTNERIAIDKIILFFKNVL